MLGNSDAVATIAVKDLARARPFYEGTLGLKPTETTEPGVCDYRSGSSSVLVYESAYAGTNRATAATWVVQDVEGTVRGLKAKGVAFEHYDLPDATWNGDVLVAGRIKAAWFKDPDGNILALVNS
jgi:catechol 2,3-dioxygenase-like lactoylglutathione lyase family enzyme